MRSYSRQVRFPPPHFFLLCRSLSDQSCSVFHYVRLVVFVLYRMILSFNAVTHFMLPESLCVVFNIISFLVCFLRFIVFLLLVLHKFLEPNRYFPLKTDYIVFLLFYWPHLDTYSGTALYTHAHLPS